MRLILSRKGMDSSFGNLPSVILPDGRYCLLPIPELGPEASAKGIPYSRIRAGDTDLGTILSQVGKGRISPETLAHLDPDLDHQAINRESGWLPTFGQSAAAESHLQAAGVGPGDIFLFFGWFRRTTRVDGKLQFDKNAPHVHAIFGWLQIDQRISLSKREDLPFWALQHPHCKGSPYASYDSLYVAKPFLDLPHLPAGAFPGGGIGARFSADLCLTAPGENRSVWQLPDWFRPERTVSPLTYHAKPWRWRKHAASPGQVVLNTVGRGQEFVLDLSASSEEAIPWIIDKIQNLVSGSLPG